MLPSQTTRLGLESFGGLTIRRYGNVFDSDKSAIPETSGNYLAPKSQFVSKFLIAFLNSAHLAVVLFARFALFLVLNGFIALKIAMEVLMGFFRFKRERRSSDCFYRVTPLDFDFVRFNVAAREIGKRCAMLDADDMLDFMVRAFWRGDFEPGFVKQPDASGNEEFCALLWIPSAVPRNLLSKNQCNLEPRPLEYHKGDRSTALHLLFCLPGLPGEQTQWKPMREGFGAQAEQLEAEAFYVLQGYSVSDYAPAGQSFLKSIYISRVLLQAWLDDQTEGFENLFAPPLKLLEASALVASDASTQNGARPQAAVVQFPRRGRRQCPAWDFVRDEVLKLHRAEPTLLHKSIAHRVHQLALRHYDAPDVPSESSIMRRIPAILDAMGR